jgi:hypothetical protein
MKVLALPLPTHLLWLLLLPGLPSLLSRSLLVLTSFKFLLRIHPSTIGQAWPQCQVPETASLPSRSRT